MKEVTVNNQVNQVNQTVTASSEIRGHAINFGTVAKSEWPAKTIGRQFVNHRSGKLILSIHEQVLLESIHPSQFLAIEKLRCRIDRLGFDLCPEHSEGIVVLKRDPPRVDPGVTRRAGWLVPVIGDPFFQSQFENLWVREVNFRDIRRRRWWWIVKDAF